MNSEDPSSECLSLVPLVQSLSGTLANIDFEHERELQRLLQIKGDPSVTEQPRTKLTQRHQERREPYIQQLALLRARAREDRKST
jgi:hypothetical protein